MQSLYVVQCGDFFKIGVSSDIKRRLIDLQLANPITLRIVYETPKLKDAKRIERYWHEQLDRKSISGEWFALDSLELQRIVSETPKMAGFRADVGAVFTPPVKNLLPRLRWLAELLTADPSVRSASRVAAAVVEALLDMDKPRPGGAATASKA